MKKFFLEDFSFFCRYNNSIANRIIYIANSKKYLDDNTLQIIENLVIELWNCIPDDHDYAKVGLRKKMNYLYVEKTYERMMVVQKANEKPFKIKGAPREYNVHQDAIYNYYYTKIAENNFNNSQYLASIGLIGEAWEWCMKSLDITYKKGQVTIQFFDFIWDQAISFHGDYKRRVALEIVSNYFSISSILGHNFNECHAKHEVTRKWLKSENNAQDIDVLYLISYFTLLNKSFNESKANEIYNKLNRIFRSKKKNDLGLANLISYYMANSKVVKLLNKDTLAWIRKYEETKVPNVNWEVAVNMELLSIIESDSRNSKIIIDTINFALNSLLKINKNSLFFSIQKQKYSYIIIRAVEYLLNINDYDTVLKIILMWKTFNPENTSPNLEFADLNSLLIIFPTYKLDRTNYIYYTNDQIHFFEYEKMNNLIELTNIRNNFEQKWTVISGIETPMVSIGNNPKEEFSEDYGKSITAFYRLVELSEDTNNNNSVNIIEFVHQNNPIAPILNTIGDNTFSSLTSRERKPIPKIKKVLIWCDPWENNPILYGHREKDVLLEIANNTKIEVDCFVGGSDDVTYESFYNRYTSDEYDLVWLICHGNFNYDNPTQSLLYLTNEIPVPIIDIINQNPCRNERRLLFLNACQSSVSEVRYDGINFSGMGTSLTNEYQSVIGHLWEVNSFAASYFGPVLFYHLINSQNWAWALKQTQKLFSKGNKEVYQFLKDIVKINNNSYLEALLSNYVEDFSELIYFGSAVIYE